jgi:hypothetical protein
MTLPPQVSKSKSLSQLKKDHEREARQRRAMGISQASGLEGDGGGHQLSARQLIDASQGARPAP